MGFALSSKRCLNDLLLGLPIQPGVSDIIFEKLRAPVAKMTDLDKTCALLFDEMAIDPALSYDLKKDHVLGLSNDGISIKPQFADHALVFMLRGIHRNFLYL